MNWFPLDRSTARTRLGPLLLVAGLLAVAALSACGSSSSGSTAAASSKSSTQSGATSAGARPKLASLRACLAKQGVTLPKRPAGAGPGSGPPTSGPPTSGQPGSGAPFGGVNREKLQAAIKKCGGTGFPGRGGGVNGAGSREGLMKFVACMRQNGVNLPEPNTSGSGPVFNTNGIDTGGATFKSARQKCQSTLKGAFGGPPPSGSPGAGTG
ncbi:MAG: hypothetical protein ACYDC2_06575 [Solirubrobacteraceae bacterium]